MTFSRRVLLAMTIAGLAFSGLTFDSPPALAVVERNITFPILGPVSFVSTFGAPRSGGRTHEGNDIFAEKGRPLIAAVDGEVQWLSFPEPSWGFGLQIIDDDGWRYRYLHLNNDNPGTDDGQGGGALAYAPGIESGAEVLEGQVVGFVGDSGNAESTPSHLHFEIRNPDGVAVDPYDSLRVAPHLAIAVPRALNPGEVLPFRQFKGGGSITTGNVLSKYSQDEFIVGAGPGGGPQVNVYSKSGRLRNSFFAFNPAFRGGVDVAAADITGNGLDDIVVSAGPGGGPSIHITKPSGWVVSSFFAYKRDTRHGVRVAAQDLDFDGVPEIITAPDRGGPPLVRVFKANGHMIREFYAYDPAFRGGVDVTAMVDPVLKKAYIVTAPGPGGGPHIRVFSHKGQLRWQFYPYAKTFRGGVRVDAADTISSAAGPEIIVVPASNGGPDYRVLTKRGKLLDRLDAYEEWWKGSHDVAAGTFRSYIVAGGQRPTEVQRLE